jgi:electron transfer flavoprotein alpha subunit
MTARIFAYVALRNGAIDDSAAELAATAHAIDPSSPPVAVITGKRVPDEACQRLLGWFGEVWKTENEALVYPNAELVRQALAMVLPRGSVVLAAHDQFGMDLCPGLSIKLDAAYVPDVVAIEGLDGTKLRVVRQEFAGQVSAHVECDVSSGAVITVRPGAFKAGAAGAAAGHVMDKSAAIGALTSRRRYLETIVAEAGDVDITRQDVLVSIGRGIQDKENIGIAQELAEALGAAVSCSRPVVDAKWLEKSRQVGSSGKTVAPKIYLACGISGAFQHLAGLKGNPFIIAINKNPKAPIFQVAQVGIVDDLLEFLPVLTEKVRAMRGVAAQ